MRKRYCRVCTGWHPVDDIPHNCQTINWNRSPLSAPTVVCDTMDGHLRSYADGKMYDSKAKLRATYKPSGNPQGESYVEVGNEPLKRIMEPKNPDRKGIEAAVGKAFSRAGLGA